MSDVNDRGPGGTDDPENLGVVHARCNSEKGRRWDPKRKKGDAEYDAFTARLAERRRQRWRVPGVVGPTPRGPA